MIIVVLIITIISLFKEESLWKLYSTTATTKNQIIKLLKDFDDCQNTPADIVKKRNCKVYDVIPVFNEVKGQMR